MNFSFEVGRGRTHRVDFAHHPFVLEFVSIQVDGSPRVMEYCRLQSRRMSYGFEAGRYHVQIEIDRGNCWWPMGSVFSRLTYDVYVDGEFVWQYAG